MSGSTWTTGNSEGCKASAPRSRVGGTRTALWSLRCPPWLCSCWRSSCHWWWASPVACGSGAPRRCRLGRGCVAESLQTGLAGSTAAGAAALVTATTKHLPSYCTCPRLIPTRTALRMYEHSTETGFICDVLYCGLCENKTCSAVKLYSELNKLKTQHCS